MFHEPVPDAALSRERPFPGLRPFGHADYLFFFGREEQAYALYRLLERGRFVAVVGGSGSGKSSLVRAGLRPLLDQESDEALGRTWRCQEMRPGSAPLAGLADALAALAPADDPKFASMRREKIALRLRQSSFGIDAALAEIPGLEKASILLIVDQFEELFRYAASNKDLRSQRLQAEEATLFVQLLLELNRKRAGKVYVLLTMRSDFIGDCVRFQGLPEAVSASQFLVPALTRDQLEDVIREPIKAAGASIEPALVERILNDCSDEPDNLPVLQHCLFRLWQQAGAEAGTEPPGAAAVLTSSRELTATHYRAIGGMAEALSHHADKILDELEAPESSVEQVMRALAEIDRESRAIRRALPYSRLRAEAGIPDSDLDEILNRFRADDCSFLLPSKATAPTLTADTSVDVGHEALLRRWKKISGESKVAGLSETDEARAKGWLHAEEFDGQRYRALLTMLGQGQRGGGILPLNRVAEYHEWWRSRPRTAAWAERYGGHHDRVVAALDASVAELERETTQRRRHKVARIVAPVALLFLVVIAAAAIYIFQQQKTAINANFKGSIDAAQLFLDAILTSHNEGDVTVKGASALASAAHKVTDNVRNLKVDDESNFLLIQVKIVEIDLAMKVADFQNALDLAKDANSLASILVANDPSNTRWMQSAFLTTLRVGDALAALQKPSNKLLDEAATIYANALGTSQKSHILHPDNLTFRKNMIFSYEKLADVDFLKTHYANSLRNLSFALDITNEMLKGNAEDVDLQRLFANIKFRMSGAFRNCRAWKKAHRALIDATEIQEELIRHGSANNDVKSNFIGSHTRRGDVWTKQNMLRNALKEYTFGVEKLETLAHIDPTNPQWHDLLGYAYTHLGEVKQSLGKESEATAAYRHAVEARKAELAREPNNKTPQSMLAQALDKLGDMLLSGDRQAEREQIYRAALVLWDQVAVEEGERAAKTWRMGGKRFLEHVLLNKIAAVRSDLQGAALEEAKAAQIARDSGETVSAWQKRADRDFDARKKPPLHGGGLRRRTPPPPPPKGCESI